MRDEREIDDRLADWVDGRMSEREHDRFVAELRVNPQLQRDLAEYERTVATVRAALQAPTVRVDLADRVMERIAHGGAAEPAPTVRQRPYALVFSCLMAAALLALAFLLDAVPSAGRGEPSSRREEVAQAPAPAPTKAPAKAEELRDVQANPVPAPKPSEDAAERQLLALEKTADEVRASKDRDALDDAKLAAARAAARMESTEAQRPQEGSIAPTANAQRASEQQANEQPASEQPTSEQLERERPPVEKAPSEQTPAVPVLTPGAVREAQKPGDGVVKEELDAHAGLAQAKPAGDGAENRPGKERQNEPVPPSVPTAGGGRGGRGGGLSGPTTGGPAGPATAGPAGPATGGPPSPTAADPAGAEGQPGARKRDTRDPEADKSAATGSDDFYLGGSRLGVDTAVEHLPCLSFTGAPTALRRGAAEGAKGSDAKPDAKIDAATLFLRDQLAPVSPAAGAVSRDQGAADPGAAETGTAAPAPEQRTLGTLQLVDVTARLAVPPARAQNGVEHKDEHKKDKEASEPSSERLWLVDGPEADVQALVQHLSTIARRDGVAFATGEVGLRPAAPSTQLESGARAFGHTVPNPAAPGAAQAPAAPASPAPSAPRRMQLVLRFRTAAPK